jgi:PAS domain S-box-containing protein
VSVYPVHEGERVREVLVVHQDVTARKQAEQELRDRERQLRETQQIARLGSWQWEIATGAVVWSDEMYHIYGLEHGSVSSHEQFLERVHPEDRAKVSGEIGGVLETGQPFAFEHRIIRPDGSVRVLSGQGKPVEDEQGKIMRLVGSARDVTERKNAEQALQRAYDEMETRVQERTAELAQINRALEEEVAERTRAEVELLQKSSEMEAVFRALPDLYFRFDSNGIILEHQSGSASGLLFVQPDQFRGRRIQEVLPPHVGAQVDAAMQSVRGTGELVRIDYQLPLADAEHDFEARLLPLRGNQIIALVRDITDRKNAERALQRSEEHFRRITENSSDVASILDASGVSIYHSPAIERVLGYPPGEILGTSSFERIHPDDHAKCKEVLGAVFRSPGSTHTVEFRYLHKDGSYRVVDVLARTLLPDSASDGAIINLRDVTERKQAEEQLRFQKTLLEAQGEASIDGILVVSDEGRILSSNRRFAEMWGIPDDVLEAGSDDAAVKWVLDRLEDPEAFLARIAELYQSPDTRSEEEILLKDGRVFDRYSAPVKNGDGRYYGRIWFFRDISDRREAELAMQRREEHFRSLIENASDLITIVDAASCFRYHSPSVERILGYKPEQLIGISAFQYMHRDDVTGARAALARMAENPGGSHSVQFRYKANDGSWRYLEATGRTLNPTSAADGIVVNSRDITDRKQAEDAVRASEESYRGLFDSLTELVYVQDLAGRFLNVNDAVLRAYGYTRQDLIGRTPDVLADPTRVDLEDTLRRFGEAVAGKPQRFEWWGRRKDGSTFPKELVLTRSTYFGREAVIAVARDITERKRADEALQEATQEAEAANRAKSEFLSRMSHELRTPMNSILGFAQLLARKELPGDQKKGVDHILKAGRHLLNLINEVLDISRIEANRQPLSLEPVQLGGSLQEAINLIRPLAAQRDCRIEEQITGSSNLYVQADRQRLTQVLLNLLSNAVKYNRAGGSVRLSCEFGDQRVRIGVHDTGRGIPADKMDQLFVPFARLGAEQSGVEGTGLGLALSKRLVEAMEGKLEVESTLGEGSTFWLDLPVVEGPLQRLSRTGHSSARLPEEIPGAPATLLYIEDNLANLSLVESILASHEEITLVPALQGRLGLDLAWEHQPDLVLLDLHLPDMSGEEVLKRLQADPRTRETPVIIISADATPGTVDRLRTAGANAYLTKPLDVDHFLATVERFLAGARK